MQVKAVAYLSTNEWSSTRALSHLEIKIFGGAMVSPPEYNVGSEGRGFESTSRKVFFMKCNLQINSVLRVLGSNPNSDHSFCFQILHSSDI